MGASATRYGNRSCFDNAGKPGEGVGAFVAYPMKSRSWNVFPRSIWASTGCLILALATGLRGAAPPEPGALAPDFTLQGLDGRSTTLSALTAKSTVVLIVLRGYPGYQCPICNRQVGELIGRAVDFAAKQARVVLIYPGPAAQLTAKAEEFRKNKDWPAEFLFLLDPDYALTNRYGLRWDAKNETAYPSTFIIGREGRVIFSKVSKTHGGRTTAAEVLARLPGTTE